MNEKKLDNILIVSPLDVRHYILDIPVVKKEYQSTAVKYGLKSLYPGNEETTETCFYYSQQKVVGVATSSEKLERNNQIQKRLISPTKLINQIESNVIAVYYSNDWIEIQVIKKRQVEKIVTFAMNSIKTFEEALKEIVTSDEFKYLPVKGYKFSNRSIIIEDILKEFDAEYIDIYGRITPSKIASSEIFAKEVTWRKIPVFIILYFLLLIVMGVSLYKEYKLYINSNEEITYIKKEYETVKKEHELIVQENVQSAENEIEKNISVNYVLSEISKTSPSLRMISFSLNGREFKFEAEKASAVKVIETLSKAEYISDVTMHHSIPQEDGTERFVISGRVNND